MEIIYDRGMRESKEASIESNTDEEMARVGLRQPEVGKGVEVAELESRVEGGDMAKRGVEVAKEAWQGCDH